MLCVGLFGVGFFVSLFVFLGVVVVVLDFQGFVAEKSLCEAFPTTWTLLTFILDGVSVVQTYS